MQRLLDSERKCLENDHARCFCKRIPSHPTHLGAPRNHRPQCPPLPIYVVSGLACRGRMLGTNEQDQVHIQTPSFCGCNGHPDTQQGLVAHHPLAPATFCAASPRHFGGNHRTHKSKIKLQLRWFAARACNICTQCAQNSQSDPHGQVVGPRPWPKNHAWVTNDRANCKCQQAILRKRHGCAHNTALAIGARWPRAMHVLQN